jgi:hypothetical protein
MDAITERYASEEYKKADAEWRKACDAREQAEWALEDAKNLEYHWQKERQKHSPDRKG